MNQVARWCRQVIRNMTPLGELARSEELGARIEGPCPLRRGAEGGGQKTLTLIPKNSKKRKKKKNPNFLLDTRFTSMLNIKL